MTRQDSIRKEILFHLYAVRPAAHLATTIQKEARKQGLDFTVTEIKAELAFLADEGVVISIEMRDSTEKLYRIHASGVRLYEQTYAA